MLFEGLATWPVEPRLQLVEGDLPPPVSDRSLEVARRTLALLLRGEARRASWQDPFRSASAVKAITSTRWFGLTPGISPTGTASTASPWL